ncbi:hypothetical protein LUU34_00249200 [Aix galericulata]|nr:hypothetical protein LUU34_00249200 [Aix galericulata]
MSTLIMPSGGARRRRARRRRGREGRRASPPGGRGRRPGPTPACRLPGLPLPRRPPRAARPAPARAPLTCSHPAHLVERPRQVGIGEDRDRSWQRGGDVIRGVNGLGELVHEPAEGHRDLVRRLGGHHGGGGRRGERRSRPAAGARGGDGGRGALPCLPLPARGNGAEPARSGHVRAGGRPPRRGAAVPRESRAPAAARAGGQVWR